MAPGRRKGANRSKAKAQLQLGDLVLAKVKGFPAWPAKISRPEDWDRLPDPKKYFVQFFGTSEIAYVAPADVQLFTNESKSKLSARSRSKSVKYFAHAVEEICEAFEELHEKKKGEPGEDTGETVASISSSTDGLKDSKHLEHHAVAQLNGPDEITEQQESDKNVCSIVELHGLECSLQNREGIIVNDVKASMESPVTSARRKKALSSEALKDAKVLAAKSTPNHFSVKQEYFITPPDVSCSEIKMEETSPKGSAGRNQQLCLSGDYDYECSPLFNKSLISKKGGAEKVVENGHEAKMNSELRRKVENSLLVKKGRASLVLGDVSTEDNIELPEHKEGFGQDDNNISPCDSARESSESTSQLVIDGHNEKLSKSLKNSRGQSSRKMLLHEDSSKMEQTILLRNVVEGPCGVFEGEKSQFGKKKHKMAGTEKSSPTKRAKSIEVGGDISKVLRVNGLSRCVPENKDVKIIRSGKSTCVESVDHLASRTENHEDKSQLPSDIVVLPPKKQCHQRPKALPCSAPKNAAGMTKKISLDKDEMQISDQDTSLVTHYRPRRRLLQYDDDVDDDDKEEHTSPVQREPPNNLMSAQSNIADSARKSYSQSECHRASSSNLNTVMIEKLCSECKERTSDVKIRPDEFEGGSCSPSPRKEDRSDALELLTHSTGRSEYKKSSYGEGKSVIVSPKTSVGPSPAARATDHKSINPQSKLLVLKAKKAQASTSKLSSKALERSNHSQKQLVNQKNKSSSSEKLKVAPKSKAKTPLIAENRSAVNFSAECNIENIIPVEGLDVAKEHEAASNAFSLIDNKLTDSSTSMKRLIAAAQAKRRQARSQCLISDAIIPFSVSTPPMIHGQSPSPISAVHNFSSGNSVPKVTKWSQFAVSSGSPSSLSQEPLSENQAEPKDFEHRVTPGYRPAEDSLNGGTEAVVARDALEGMLETLSRTRDSIGRATRLAIDCAKYGIASEVGRLF